MAANRQSFGVLTGESEKSGEIGSQEGYGNHGFLLAGQRTEPSLRFPPIFFWAAMNFCYNVHFPLLLWSGGSAQFLHSEHQR